MNNTDAIAIAAEFDAITRGVEDFFLDVCDQADAAESAWAVQAAVIEALELGDRVFALYCDGFDVDRAAHRCSVSILHSIRTWVRQQIGNQTAYRAPFSMAA